MAQRGGRLPYTARVPLILLNKPYRVLSQFRDADGRSTLANFISLPGVYPCGRLDYDSEGLMLLTDDGRLQARITEPGARLAKTYLVQVEGTAGPQHIEALKSGVTLKDGPACAIDARLVPAPPALWPREPPIRYRASIPTSWMEISIDEGRNRQIRRMTAATGLPTLRLIRLRVGPWSVGSLRPGENRLLDNKVAWRNLESPPQLPL
ncbi:MAG TPA: pseudouridine synthase [Woeseiaceae bacterium]|nr:pseudouridine synthase [Woeseiaceae bacterium]